MEAARGRSRPVASHAGRPASALAGALSLAVRRSNGGSGQATRVGRVARVRRGGAAARAGVRVGDWLLAVDGLAPRDAIDLGYATAGALLHLALERDGERRKVSVARAPGEDLGLEFDAPTLDGIRRCANACAFCFIDGLPEGMRDTLYVRDDDYRYSFLYGSFVTLTNLRPADEDRVCYQRLSPLRVSVHATDLAVRRRLLANPRAPDILPQLDRLGAAGIEFHAQVVLVPGVNDGAVLDQTVRDLAARYPAVRSVAVVPVGLTRHSHTAGVRTLTAADAAAALDLCGRWQRRLRAALGVRFVYPSDELYLLAGRPFPPLSHYDDYPQLQNGIGLVPLFLADWRRARRRLRTGNPRSVSVAAATGGERSLFASPTAPPLPAAAGSAAPEPLSALQRGGTAERACAPRRVLWVCGQAMERALGLVAAELAGVDGLAIEVVAVPNAFFGTGVTVSGLLTATDVVRALAGRAADRVVLPRAMFDITGTRTLDDWTRDELAARLPGVVQVAQTATELLEATCAA
jgi:putative radical SAM enzyme (TIGR03279 family)